MAILSPIVKISLTFLYVLLFTFNTTDQRLGNYYGTHIFQLFSGWAPSHYEWSYQDESNRFILLWSNLIESIKYVVSW